MAHNYGLPFNQALSTLGYSGLLFPATWLSRYALLGRILRALRWIYFLDPPSGLGIFCEAALV